MSSILHFIKAGGFVMYPLLLLSFAAIAIIVERLIAYRELAGLAPGLLDEVIALCSSGRDQEALRACQARTGPLAASLAVVLRHRRQPVREVERMVEETGQRYFLRMEHWLPVLDTTTTVAPLLGLLGTISGMIGTFRAISVQTGHGGNTDAILAGVGEALYATATGLTIAVICFAAYNYFSARLRTATGETEQAVTRLINTLTDLRHLEAASHDDHKGELHGVQAATRA